MIVGLFCLVCCRVLLNTRQLLNYKREKKNYNNQRLTVNDDGAAADFDRQKSVRHFLL
jgi:hypothetical protein